MRLRRDRAAPSSDDLKFIHSVIEAARTETRLARTAIQDDIAGLRGDVAKVLELLESLAGEGAS